MPTTRGLPRIGVIAALTVGLAMAFQPAASAVAEAPAVTVTPSSDLEDGTTVTVRGTGFGAGQTLYVAQCTDVEQGRACHEYSVPSVSFTTDGSGAGSAQFSVHRTYEGFTLGSGYWGTVDCTVLSCYIAVARTESEVWKAPPLSFR